MIDEIVIGISMKLNNAFGNDYEIYSNSVKQGLKEPCFFISVIKSETNLFIGNRFFKRNSFNIHYFPKNQGDNKELFAVADRMIETLNFITLENGDKLQGVDNNYEVVDGVLHFFISYNLSMIKSVKQTYMKTLKADVSMMGGD